MSIPNLPVNFKDDILASSNTKRKYRQTTNDDSTVSFEDVTNYSQEGSEFGAKEVNQTNTAINNIYDERVLDVDALELITEPGFFVDAQAVKELNGKMELSEYNVDNLNIYEENGIVHVNGMVAINAATGNIQLPYANAGIKDVHAPVIGVFQNMSIAGYGYLNLGRNTNAAYIGLNTAATYAIMAFSYKRK